jgi:hypothetical protein
LQEQASNHPELLWSKAMVVSVEGKGATRSRQVWIRKTNASEPLMTCRKRRNGVKTGGKSLTREESRRYLLTAWAASGMEVA